MTADLKRLAEAALEEEESSAARFTRRRRDALRDACTPATILALCKQLEEAERKVEAWGPIVAVTRRGDVSAAAILAGRLSEDLKP